MSEHATFDLLPQYKHLRVADVSDALDGIGYFDLCLMDSAIRPLWNGMKFWGVALTMRCVPAGRPMWKLDTTEEIVNSHGIWFKEVGNQGIGGMVKPGHVVVTSTGGAREVGFWGSANALNVVAGGGVGIVTDGFCRDTAELELQRTPICSRERGRPIIPGRIEVADLQSKVGCGGVQVNPGDLIGCDADGVLVVPQNVAAEVAVHGRAVLIADMKARHRLDETVDVEAVEAYYEQL
ncbi:MAG: RraA family protein [Candidatus Poribacteria bacterium]|nr:RraA family protein [Candidatus Poribacteria bacterium]